MQFKVENGKLLVADNSPKNIGLCCFCHRPVYAAPGQAITWKIVTMGEIKTENPTHKICRKLDKLKNK